MAKIVIMGSPEELKRIATFLKNNNVFYTVEKDYGNHSKEDETNFDEFINEFKFN